MFDGLEEEFLKQHKVVTDKKVKLIKERIASLLEKDEIDFSDFIIPMTKESGKLVQKMIVSSILHGAMVAKESMVSEFDEDFKNIFDKELFDKYDPKVDTEVTNVIRSYAFELSKFYDESNAFAVKQIVADGIEKGMSPQDIAKSLNAYVDKVYSSNHARTIVRTESTRGYALGSLTYYLQDETVDKLEYSSVLDERTTDICKSRDGNVYLKKDPRIPYLIPAHYNCRSIWIPVMEEDTNETPDPQEPEGNFETNHNGFIDMLFPLLVEGLVIAGVTQEEEV